MQGGWGWTPSQAPEGATPSSGTKLLLLLRLLCQGEQPAGSFYSFQSNLDKPAGKGPFLMGSLCLHNC